MHRHLASALFLASALLGIGAGAQAQGHSLDKPGSLLLFPLFDNARVGLFAITVTNTNSNRTEVGNLLAGTVDVEFIYVRDADCMEFNRTRRLTPNDTITVSTAADNPNQNRGYVYVFAKSPTSGAAISWNYLAGDSIGISPLDLLATDLPPIVFQAIAADGIATDVDHDGIRDLNGVEYGRVPDEILIPRFISFHNSKLILIGLSGSSFTTVVDFLAYNDNEDQFSGQVVFDCWAIKELKYISGAFTDDFLEDTNDNPGEYFPGGILLGNLEYGWLRMDGSIAYSTAAQIDDPAFLAVRIDDGAFASLPYGNGFQANGDLIPHGPFGDPFP